ncbi:MAG TPA: lamin tail domain-containing protein, partial [Phycisphaerae bacterium]|nr:lamin tail domain-containing protein [Phycisphaerae bacterium]
QALWDLAQSGFATDEAYYRVQGLNPDGTRNPDHPVYLDIDNLVDYMIVILYTGNRDAPISNFLGNNRPNNWYGIRDRTGETGFQFFAHDCEHTLLVGDLNVNRNGPWPAGDTFNYSNPQWFHQELMAHPEYRMQFADHVQEYFFNDGLLTPQKATERFLARAAEIELAIIAESARWGDAKVTTPRSKTDWENTINDTVNNYFPQRTGIVLNQFRNTVLRDDTPAPLYPAVVAPTFSQHGGQVAEDFPLFIDAPAGSVYYTLDGSDPRLPGGAVNPEAILYEGAVAAQTLVPQGATWKYLDDGSDRGTAWRETSFDDNPWAAGPAQLGYGEGDEQTVVGFGPDSGNKYITTYFRHDFNVTNPGLFQGLTLRLLRDDGAVVYLNGQEVARSNMPGGDVDCQTLASAIVGGAAESTFFEFAVDPARLVEGPNVLAVELHQGVVTSSDVSFDLELEATLGADPIVLGESTVVNSRALEGGQWSALNEAAFYVGTAATADNLAVTELNYNPPDPTPQELAVDPAFTGSSFEFIELINTSDTPIDLTEVRFVDGVTFDFTGASVNPVAPGGRVVVVANRAGFEARYGTGILLAGEYVGSLNNGGETLELTDRFGQAIVRFTYDDSGAWPGRADGKGSSLEIVDPHGFAANPDNWRSSTEYGGSPGSAGLGAFADVIVNEVLSRPADPAPDAIELFNTSGEPIDMGGWYLSDSSGNYRKFRIADGTTIPAGGYLVFDENDFNSSGGVDPNDFALDADGDDVWLLQTDTSDRLVRFADHAEFGSALPDVTFGRWPNGTGKLVMMAEATLGWENAGPRVGSVVIN